MLHWPRPTYVYVCEQVLVLVFQELSSLLSMHGFQSLEDFAGLKESHLNELNITDPEQRSKILNTTELLRDCTYTTRQLEPFIFKLDAFYRDTFIPATTECL